jgi:uncharacterized protein
MSQDEHPIARRARHVAEALLVEVEGASAAVIATTDGFNIAHAGSNAVDPSRLAAIVSSLAALGDAAGRETHIGATKCVVVDSTDGRLVVRCVQVHGETFIVVLLTDQGVLLGRVLNGLGMAERLMSAA